MSPHFAPTKYAASTVEDSIEVGKRAFYEHEVTPRDRRLPFGMELAAGRMGAITIGVLRYASEVSVDVRGIDSSYAVGIPLTGTLLCRTHTFEEIATPARAVVLGPVGDTHLRGWNERSAGLLQLKFERATLESELGRILNREISKPIDFMPTLDVSSGAGAQWRQLLATLASGMSGDHALLWNPLMTERLSSAIATGLLLSTEHSYRELLDGRTESTSPASIRRACAYIDEHLQDPLTVPLVASAAGMSVRSLERGFLKYLSISPRRYIERGRLAQARSDLVLATDPGTTVTEIAARWGFAHLGRFADIYRRTYGQSPSDTLRDSLR